MTSSNQLSYLLKQFAANEISAEETKELFALLKEHGGNEEVKEIVRQLWSGYTGSEPLPVTDWASMYEKIIAVPVIKPAKRFYSARIAATIALILALGAGLFLIFINTKKTKAPVARNEQPAPSNDALPGTTKAVLTLADGRRIVLDSVSLGKLADQGGAEVINQGNSLAYNPQQVTSEIIYNTLTTQRGEQFPLTLSDGTKAWLNAASSIRYPVVFSGSERVVEITGEVYFEVAHNTAKPFTVKKVGDELAVQVLGTHFNVNAYDDEKEIKVTLLEGSVVVRHETSVMKIKPGQQAILTDDGQLKASANIDIEAVMAWKNGYFSFHKADLPTVMRQLSRWYDVEVVYEGKIPVMKFGGGITRNTNLSQVLKILEESKVKFMIEGKKLIVRI